MSSVIVGGLTSLAMAVILAGPLTGSLASASEVFLTHGGAVTSATPGIAVSQATGATICHTGTCSDANLFGGTSAPLMPGRTRSITMRFANTGRQAIGTRRLVSGNCVSTTTPGVVGSTTPTGTRTLCDALRLEVFEGSATTGTRLYAGPPATLPTAITLGALAVHASVLYTFRVSLPATADSASQGQTITQPLTWTNNV